MSEQLSGHAQMDANAAEQIAAVNKAQAEAMKNAHTEALVMDAAFDKRQGIETRQNGLDVKLLNDAAQIEIFGTGGKTAGYTDAKGNPLQAPIQGKVQEIRENPRFGTTRAERETAATKYVEEIKGMVDSGLELSQAKLVMDIRQERETASEQQQRKLVGSYISNKVTIDGTRNGRPLTPQEAEQRAAKRVAKDNLRKGDDEALTLKVVKEEGLFSRTEYNKFRYGARRSRGTNTARFEKYVKENVQAEANRAKSRQDAGIKGKIAATQLAREQVREAERVGRGGAQPQAGRPGETVKGYEFPNGYAMHYMSRQDRKIQLGIEVDKHGSKLEFSKHGETNDPNNRRIVATEKDGDELYVRGTHLYRFRQNKNGETEMVGSPVYLGDAQLSDLTLGGNEGWQINKDVKTEHPIDDVEIATEVVDATTRLTGFEPNGTDPFEEFEALIAAQKQQLQAARQAQEKGRGWFPGGGERNNRRRQAGRLIGGVLLGGLIGLGASALVHDGQHNSNKPVPPRTKKGGHKPHRAHEVTLRPGQNPWTVSAHELRVAGNPNPSNAQIKAYDLHMAHENSGVYSYTGDSSEHIPVGTKLKLPSRR